MTPHFILLCFIPLLVLIFFKNSKLRRKTLDPPGPPGLPLLGNLHQFDANNTHLYVWELSQKYGPIMSLKLGSVPTLVISSAKMAKEVMKTYYDNIFASRPKHLALQKLSYYEFATLAPIREDEVARLAKKISEFASLGKVVDFRKTMMFVSSSFICRVAFGKRYEEGGLESRRSHQRSSYEPFYCWNRNECSSSKLDYDSLNEDPSSNEKRSSRSKRIRLQNLPYCKAIIKETPIFYPPVPLLIPRETIGSCMIDGYEIQPKTSVFVNVWAIGRDPEYWDNPNEFLPERFLNTVVQLISEAKILGLSLLDQAGEYAQDFL
ncbi:hypothetical protein Leryth_006804 [Lithospermum erythrorhizon]|nr:hypothetical protein Leryth_006804 [Lithospermum erythrorhizon]